MTPDRERLERELARLLADTAPTPARDALSRLNERLAATPQGSGPMLRLAATFRSVAWPRAVAVAGVAAAALLVGIFIGQVGLPIQVGPSGSPSADVESTTTPSGPEGWVEPDAYSYVLDSTCGERLLIGRFRITVAGGVVKDAQALLDTSTRPQGLEGIPTLGDLLAELEDARRSGAFVATLMSDPGDGHPVEIMIDQDEEAVDDEACYRISEYRPAGEATPRPEPTTPAAPMPFAVWERLDMPDPTPGVFGGGTPSSVVAFDGRYVAVGTILTECCAEADPAANVGVVWTSTNGADWQLVDVGDTFEHASLGQVVTDGERLIAAGSFAELVDGALSTPIGATWTSSDGISWQRSDGDAPSMVAVTPSGLIGARVVDDGVAYFSSPDGARWTRHGLWPDVDEVSAVIPRGEGAMVIGTRSGAPLADGSPTQDSVVWVSTDGANWTGGSTVQNARLTSVAPFAGGFVAVGSRTEVLAEGGEVAAISSVWISQDGLSWQERETDIGDPSETAMGVFAVGEALVITVECCGGDMVLRPLAWVSEDGASWSPVPPQPAFEGVDIRIASVVASPDGLLAVGSRWDSETNHPIPQAWIASDEPMVWLEPISEPGAEIGTQYEFRFGNCGLQSPIDFDGSLWALGGSDYVSPPVPLDMLEGTIRLTGPDSAIFEDSASNWRLALSRHERPRAYPLCD